LCTFRSSLPAGLERYGRRLRPVLRHRNQPRLLGDRVSKSFLLLSPGILTTRSLLKTFTYSWKNTTAFKRTIVTKVPVENLPPEASAIHSESKVSGYTSLSSFNLPVQFQRGQCVLFSVVFLYPFSLQTPRQCLSSSILF
jgi:hypothetical protein